MLLVVAGVLIAAATVRREYLGDGVRHLTAAVSPSFQFGEPRWLLFPPLARFLVRSAGGVGLAHDSESALRVLLWSCVASGVIYLYSLRAWLRMECSDNARRTAALLLAGSCAPILILFSDIAEPQIAAGVALAALAYARVRRDDPRRARSAAVVAILGVGAAAIVYQGMVLALGMLPLVVAARELRTPRVLTTIACVIVLLPAAMIAAQLAQGLPRNLAVATTIAGEQNPLARSLMASQSPLKYLAALAAGPPQAILALDRFSGLRALATALRDSDSSTASIARWNVCRLLLAFVVTAALGWRGARDRQWWLLAAASVLLMLPVLRNEQYGYVKFFVLWPVPVALLSLRWRARTIFMVATIVLVANGWLLARDITRGREAHDRARDAYARATPSTCWMTIGWSAPFHYLWPGTTANVLGTLATGSDPARQILVLNESLRRCFCDADGVWTDATTRDAGIVATLATHFHAEPSQLPSFLLDPRESTAVGPPLIYDRSTQQRSCRLASALAK